MSRRCYPLCLLLLAIITQAFPVHKWRTLVTQGKGSFLDDGFPTFSETHALLDAIAADNPESIARLLVGVSFEGRPQFAYWIHLTEKQDLRRTQTLKRTQSLNRTPPRNNNALSKIQCELLRRIVLEENDSTIIRTLYTQTLNQHQCIPIDDALMNATDFRPTMLMTSLHHAREPESLMVPLYAFGNMARAVENWMHDDRSESQRRQDRDMEDQNRILHYLRSRDVLFMPFVNPDGYVAIELTKNRDIRKNRRPTCPIPPAQSSAYDKVANFDGVDINRNYDNHFVIAHEPCDPEEYEGGKAFSEPETRSVRRLAETFRGIVTTALNFHSYGDIWTHPYNCCANKTLDSLTTAIFDEIGERLDIQGFGSAPTLATLGYETSGEADDWLLAELGVISMSPEVGAENFGFFPPWPSVVETCKHNHKRIESILSKTAFELSGRLCYNTLEKCTGVGRQPGPQGQQLRPQGQQPVPQGRQPLPQSSDRKSLHLIFTNTGLADGEPHLTLIALAAIDSETEPLKFSRISDPIYRYDLLNGAIVTNRQLIQSEERNSAVVIIETNELVPKSRESMVLEFEASTREDILGGILVCLFSNSTTHHCECRILRPNNKREIFDLANSSLECRRRLGDDNTIIDSTNNGSSIRGWVLILVPVTFGISMIIFTARKGGGLWSKVRHYQGLETPENIPSQ